MFGLVAVESCAHLIVGWRGDGAARRGSGGLEVGGSLDLSVRVPKPGSIHIPEVYRYQRPSRCRWQQPETRSPAFTSIGRPDSP